MNDKVELRAAAARLLYNDQRDSADYGLLVDYIDQSASVKHGKWIGEEVIQCSNCNFTLNGTSYGRIVHKYFSYCPKCGARMDGGAE